MASAVSAKRSDRQPESGTLASTLCTAAVGPVPSSGSETGVRASVARLKGWIIERLATEHRCAPPGPAGSWVQVAARDASTDADAADAYVCPECGGHWRLPVKGGPLAG